MVGGGRPAACRRVDHLKLTGGCDELALSSKLHNIKFLSVFEIYVKGSVNARTVVVVVG